jgi:uncharacterized iron-regulated membrane protein
MTRLKIFFRNIHLYLSLAAGVIIMLSCITGTVLVFEKEINQALHPERYFVEQKGNRLPLAKLVAKAKQQMPKGKLISVLVYDNPARSVEAGIVLPEKKEKKEEAKPASQKEKIKEAGKPGEKDKKPKEAKRANATIYLNPYTGQLLGQFSKKDSFLYTVEMLHRFLLGSNGSIGNRITGISTLLFLFILITGVVLWWPKTKNILRQRLKIKWDGTGKRLTHDLHVVFGFYTSIFLIVIVLTGLVMSFDWANDALYAITASKKVEQPEPPQSAYKPEIKPLSIDAALRGSTGLLRTAEYYNVRFPADSAAAYNISVLTKGSPENTSDTYYIDQYNGKQLGAVLYADKNLGQRVRALVKPVHTGAVYGLPTKIISFIVCLLACIFPVTGVMMWLNRIKKKGKKPGKKRVSARPELVAAE